MRFSLLLVAGILTVTLPVVSGCAKKEAPPTVLELKSFTAPEGGFTIDMPEPHQEKVVDVGRAYFFNCPEGSYKVIVNTQALMMSNTSSPAARQNRDAQALEKFKNKSGAYVDNANSEGSVGLLVNSKYPAFDEKGKSGSSGGGSDGKRHMKIKYSDNDITIADNTMEGAYRIQGVVGDNALYAVCVEGRPEFVDSPQAKQFFDSLKINGTALPPGK